MMKKSLLFLFLFLNAYFAFSQQQYNFGATEAYVKLEEVTIPSFPVFHSAAVGNYDGKWVIIGGRTNGLHGFYPPFAFPSNGIQNQMYVVDPTAGSVWSTGLDSLPQPLKEQLASSNMQQCVIGDKLYIAGGYGYSLTQDEYITFPYLTQVDLPSLYQAVIAGTSPASSFKCTVDSNMAVTGGRMLKFDSRLYLFFGHKFTGRYSNDDGSTFEQRYTYQLRMFNVSETSDSINITNYTAITDSTNFRRRDLNVTHFVNGWTNDSAGFMAWSGVFKADEDRPYTNAIFIRPDGSYEVKNQVQQKYNQYHCASIPIQEDYTTTVLFFGGMAENSPLTSDIDTLVPFVKNVSAIYANNLEFEFSAQALTSFWGTNAEFIPADEYFIDSIGMVSVPHCTDERVIGHIIGGIESTGPHISTFNDPSLSFASNKIYKVSAIGGCWGVHENAIASIQVFPNPSADIIRAKTDENITHWQVTDISGKTVIDVNSNGTNSLDISLLNKGTYFIKLFTEGNLYRSTFIKI